MDTILRMSQYSAARSIVDTPMPIMMRQRATELGMESTLKRWLSSLEWITTAKVIGPITGETALSCFEHSLLV
ncbi:predicted protein [Lichtheimia corymbifera JMRC:FSU:9682]|uniref:Uncharacterized protein n=1 Tax=Lichtheimia corymbifera JMRC:FSU:9682 TaxID=1263082 RepID=A0A068RN47_9FUNG|nr:predicted protein [Lichtheimia corymbifera JMRC:FSU:9682]